MKQKIEFTVYGKPEALKRHRHFKMATRIATYDPSKEDKKDFLSVAISNKPDVPFDEPIEVTFDFFFPRPKNHYRTGKFSGMLKDNAPVWHTSTPDIDNTSKLIMDSLNKVFWRDDSIICSIIALKRYSETPRTEITIETID